MRHPSKMPSLVYADSEGQIYDLPELKMAGRSGRVLHPVDLKDLIPLPEGSELFVLPDRLPVGWDQDRDDMVVLDEDPGNAKGKVRAVAVFMALPIPRPLLPPSTGQVPIFLLCLSLPTLRLAGGRGIFGQQASGVILIHVRIFATSVLKKSAKRPLPC